MGIKYTTPETDTEPSKTFEIPDEVVEDIYIGIAGEYIKIRKKAANQFARDLQKIIAVQEEKEELEKIMQFENDAECYDYIRSNANTVAKYESRAMVSDSILKVIPVILLASIPLSLMYIGAGRIELLLLGLLTAFYLSFVYVAYRWRISSKRVLNKIDLFNEVASNRADSLKTPSDMTEFINQIMDLQKGQERLEAQRRVDIKMDRYGLGNMKL